VALGVAAADGAGEVGPAAIRFVAPRPVDVVAWPRFRTAPKTSPPVA
jgi:hypothetical protein